MPRNNYKSQPVTNVRFPAMRSRTAWTICLVLGLIFIYLHLTSSSNPKDETISQLPPPIKILQNSQDSRTTTQQNITPAIPEDVVRIYIGVVTAWWNFSARLLLREIYNQFRVKNLLHPNDTVDIHFILGRPQAVDIGIPRLLEWEAAHFGDIHVLEMEENMNDGKSYEFFADLGRRFPQGKQEDRKWDYAMKVDDDTFVYLPRLLERLRSIVPRTDTYLVCSVCVIALPNVCGYRCLIGLLTCRDVGMKPIIGIWELDMCFPGI